MNQQPTIIKHVFPGQSREFRFSMTGKPIMYHVGISGGKDSGATLLYMVKESGIPPEQIYATFSDTKNEDEATYRHVRLLSERVHPIEWINPEYGFYELAQHKKRFPSPKARFCTVELKMKPTQAVINRLDDEGYYVISCSGVRADESLERSKLSEWADPMDSYFHVPEWRPLLRWTIVEVVQIHKRYGIPMNELYALGARRVGCFPCIMSRKREMRMIARHRPGRIDLIREWEARVDSSGNGWSSFYPYRQIPAVHRRKEIHLRDGGTMNVASIDDVVAWARTGDKKRKNNLQYAFDYDEPIESDDSGVCPSQYGACE